MVQIAKIKKTVIFLVIKTLNHNTRFSRDFWDRIVVIYCADVYEYVKSVNSAIGEVGLDWTDISKNHRKAFSQASKRPFIYVAPSALS